MNTMNTIINLPIILDENLSSPLYEQLSHSLRDAIKTGKVSHGTVLDSTRDLSRKLGISRHTVLRSVDILQSQGYLESKNGRLTAVSCTGPETVSESIDAETNPAQTINVQPDSFPIAISEFAEQVVADQRLDLYKELNCGALPADQLPFKHWKKLMYKHIQTEYSGLCDPVVDPLGHEPLRVQLTDYLKRTRSLDCDPDRVVIFPDTMSALDLIGKLLINPGDRIAVENPGFRHSRRVFEAYKGKLCPIDVDENGLCVDQLNRLSSPPKMACVTPSHHDPLGMPMSLSRRQELLEWATKNGTLILEDDNDSLFRYASRPLPSLQGLDSSKSSVIYLSSFGKVLSPLVRLSFAVFPAQLIPLIANAKEMFQRNVPVLDQMVLADFIREGYVERHIRKSALSLLRRRNALITALTRCLGRKIWIARESAGTHIFVRIKTDWVDAALVEAAKATGLPMASTQGYYLSERPPTGQFIISFADIEETNAQPLVESFAKLIA